MNRPRSDRSRARALCDEYARRGDPTGWFEALYREAAGDETSIPWADRVPNPHLLAWHAGTGHDLRGKRCLKIGCGLGDDAEYLAAAGGEVVAFDISETAIAWCRRRHPASRVRYVAADLLEPPREWSRGFDFVLESYTLQALPEAIRRRALERVAGFVATDGVLLVICRGRDPGDPPGELPWPLTRREVEALASLGLRERLFEDFRDDEEPPVRRFRACYVRDA